MTPSGSKAELVNAKGMGVEDGSLVEAAVRVAVGCAVNEGLAVAVGSATRAHALNRMAAKLKDMIFLEAIDIQEPFIPA